jgi:hypothetical protein
VNTSQAPVARWHNRRLLVLFLIATAIVALQALVLIAMGQPPICNCGTVKLWHGLVSSAENSQHVADWYTYSHVIHGFAFYFLLWLIAPRMSVGARFLLAIGIEASWEVFENTPFIINRYRQSALALGYTGDSVINSVFDSLAAALGFLLARFLPVWTIVVSAIAMELFAGYMIRDNLVLNILQLLFASKAISAWQAGA